MISSTKDSSFAHKSFIQKNIEMTDHPDDIRWQQRFNNFEQALKQLKEAIELKATRDLSDLENQGLIQAFEYTHELAWNTMQDYLQHQGNFDIKGSRDATKAAFKVDLITDGDTWIDMIRARNLTSHAYDKEMMLKAIDLISISYFPLFMAFENTMKTLCQN